MAQDKDLYILDKKILDAIKNFSIFNGNYKDFNNFIRTKNDSNFIESMQIICLYDHNKKIIDYQIINVVPKKRLLRKFFDKFINFLYPQYEITISKSRFQILLESKISLSCKLFNESNIVLLEIPKNKSKVISQIKYFFDGQHIEEEKNSFFNFGKIQILSTIYLALIFLVLYRIVSVIPLNVINESEIFLAVKLILIAFFPMVALLALISIPTIALYGMIFREMNYEVYKGIVVICKILFFGYFIISASLSVLQLYYINTKKILMNYSFWSYPFHEHIANWYLDNKVSLVFDKTINKPILLFGIKDGVYYFDDIFDNCKLKIALEDSNLTVVKKTEKLKKLLLNIDNNSSTVYRNYNWKIKNIKELNFDYNNTLISQTILQCDN